MTHRPEESRSARRLARTRRQLLTSARALIAEKGVDGLRLRDIAEHADIGFGSFYTHFADKDALLEAVVAQAFEDLTTRIVVVAEQLDDAREAVSASHRGFVRLAHDDRALAHLILHLDHADSIFEGAVGPHARSTLKRGVEDGHFAVEPRASDVVLIHAVGATLAVMRGVLEGRLSDDADEASAAALLRALGVPGPEAQEIAARPLPAAP